MAHTAKCKYGRRVKGKCPTKKSTERRGNPKKKMPRRRRKLTPAELARIERSLEKSLKAWNARLKARGYEFDIDR